ncbi:MAG: hypothetical protein ACK2TV_14680 [Anaerolineales bacterium]
MLNIIRETITDFCKKFIQNPYLCYTEHGLHALFYTMLFNALSEEQRYLEWDGQKVCVIQKEYPTAMDLGKSRRQHWDIALLKKPPESIKEGPDSYDYLKLLAAIEFGMNEGKDHLEDDMERLCHKGSNVDHGFIVHLYRFSESGALFSNRDWSNKSPRILTKEEACKCTEGNLIEMYYAISDITKKMSSGLWKIHIGQETQLTLQ